METSGDDYNVYIPIVNAFERLGRNESARRVRQRLTSALEQQLELVPEDVRARILLANTHAFFGKEDDAVRQLQTAVALKPGDSGVLYNAACTYGILQRKTEALEMMKKAKEVGYANWDWAARDPDLACLYDDPEFQRLCQSGTGD